MKNKEAKERLITLGESMLQASKVLIQDAAVIEIESLKELYIAEADMLITFSKETTEIAKLIEI